MSSNMLFRSIRLSEFLSYGSDSEAVELKPLNVIIGLNGSGKSNLMEAMSVLQATVSDLPTPLREGGGTAEWLWKGDSACGVAALEVVANCPHASVPLCYKLSFGLAGQKFELIDEVIENAEKADASQDDVDFDYRYRQGTPIISMRSLDTETHVKKMVSGSIWDASNISSVQSILSQISDPNLYPEVAWFGRVFGGIRIFRNWDFGSKSVLRMPQAVDQSDDFLLSDASNLALIINDFIHRGMHREIVGLLGKFYDGIEEITTKVHGGTIQLFLRESGMNQPIPASRLSDGTLRYLCLIAVLCHPEPPSLICIDEPELGIHPDVLPVIGELLIEASQRCQLIVTTHSDALVSALSDTPESVLVCEKMRGCSCLRHLEPDALQDWLKDYSLGDIWRMGEIGGNR